MPERSRPTNRPSGKKRASQPNKNIFSRYLSWWILGGALIVIAIILGVLFLTPSVQTDPLDKSMGPADAKVVIAEYGDFQCPGCKDFALNTTPKIKADFVDKGLVRFTFRQMSFIGAESLLAAEASECANEQGKFWEYYEKVFQNQGGENVGTYSTESLTNWANELKLDSKSFSSCLSSHKYRGKVRQETQTGEGKDILSTPAVLINDKLVEPGTNYEQLKALILQAVASEQ